MTRRLEYALIAGTFALAACGTTTAQQAALATCQTGDSALKVATAINNVHTLSAAQQAAVTKARDTMKPECTAATPSQALSLASQQAVADLLNAIGAQ